MRLHTRTVAEFECVDSNDMILLAFYEAAGARRSDMFVGGQNNGQLHL